MSYRNLEIWQLSRELGSKLNRFIQSVEPSHRSVKEEHAEYESGR